MARYHINPTTGNPGKCIARDGKCPYGTDLEHFDSIEAAREAFEQGTQSFSESLRKRNLEVARTSLLAAGIPNDKVDEMMTYSHRQDELEKLKENMESFRTEINFANRISNPSIFADGHTFVNQIYNQLDQGQLPSEAPYLRENDRELLREIESRGPINVEGWRRFTAQTEDRRNHIMRTWNDQRTIAPGDNPRMDSVNSFFQQLKSDFPDFINNRYNRIETKDVDVIPEGYPLQNEAYRQEAQRQWDREEAEAMKMATRGHYAVVVKTDSFFRDASGVSSQVDFEEARALSQSFGDELEFLAAINEGRVGNSNNLNDWEKDAEGNYSCHWTGNPDSAFFDQVRVYVYDGTPQGQFSS